MQSDEALAKGIQSGDQDAMNALFERYYSPLLRYLYRMNGAQQALAEDMVQETFLRMMRGIVSYDAARPFKPWLYQIATNIVRNHYQRADTRYTDNIVDDRWTIADGVPQPEDHLIERQQQQAVIRALQALPAHQREVVVLYYFEALAQKDIAEILRIPVGTVKSRLSLGLKRLRQLLIYDEVSDTHE